MIEFVTLLIGLVVGPRQVEMAVQGGVAAIEVGLDGQQVSRLENPPWILEVDFGDRLVPHRLTATTFDERGQTLDSTSQIVNYSRSSFEAAILLDPVASDPARTGRVLWRGALNEPPRQIDLRFDNRVLPVDTTGEFVLPEYDPQALHVLEATVIFADGSTGVAHLTFGGQYVDQTNTTLTAVPLSSVANWPWSENQPQNWLQRDGQPLDVFTVTAPTGIAVILRDDRLEKATRSVLPWRDRMVRSQYSSSGSETYQVMAICARPLEGSPRTFRLSRPANVNPRYGLRQILLHVGPLVPNKRIDGRKLVKKGQKLWDSLAVAGLNAARKNTPRLVILMISNKLADNSQLTARQTLDYLSSIHVPLLVWASDKDHLAVFGLSQHPRAYLGPAGLADLEEEVGRELSSQTIVWVKGEHLPTEISLSATAPPEVALVK